MVIHAEWGFVIADTWAAMSQFNTAVWSEGTRSQSIKISKCVVQSNVGNPHGGNSVESCLS